MTCRAQIRHFIGVAAFILVSSALFASTLPTVPAGIVLPAQLNSTLSSRKARPGQTATARIMQDVPLPDGSKIPAGSTIVGHVVSVTPAAAGSPGALSIRFDALRVHGGKISLSTHLRAIASSFEVDQAQIPLNGADRGTSQSSWTTVQIGGDIVYRGGGPVEGRYGKVGRPVNGGVLAVLTVNPDAGCSGSSGEGELQALWLFSSDACGTYSLHKLEIVQSGSANPVGEIKFAAKKGDVNIPSGSGLLLRVNAAPPSA
jgi:hypothetical protein